MDPEFWDWNCWHVQRGCVYDDAENCLLALAIATGLVVLGAFGLAWGGKVGHDVRISTSLPCSKLTVVHYRSNSWALADQRILWVFVARASSNIRRRSDHDRSN